ncbi:hypothetical protein FJ05194_1311 [Mycobacterium tuberculosis FJ05194]|nr:hypothetical protein FJ05194_1311 [Mycobacterium tuberculosis FJ05194]
MGLAIVSGSAAGAGVVASTVVAFGTYGGVSRLSPPPPPQPPSATTSASPAVANGVR